MNEELELGTEVYIYQPDGTPSDDDFTDLTATIGQGFGNPLTKYAWSAELFDGSDANDTPELYVGTFSTQQSIIGQLIAAVQFPFLLGAGAFDISPLLNGLGITEPTDEILDFLLLDLPNLINSEGGEIWRYEFENDTWTQVLGTGMPEGLIEDGDIGIRDLETFDGALYAATTINLIFNFYAGGDGAAKLLVSETGEPGDFVELTGGPLDLESTASIRALTNATLGGENVLLVGTENVELGAQVWSYDTDGNWELVASFDGVENQYAASVSEIEEIDGEIIIGTWLPYKLYAITDEGDVEDRTPDPTASAVDPTSPIDDNGVMQIKVYDGYVYVGSVNYDGGASLYRIPIEDFTGDGYDNTAWETITTNGFQDTTLSYYYDSDPNNANS